jgi:hypothetical protein
VNVTKCGIASSPTLYLPDIEYLYYFSNIIQLLFSRIPLQTGGFKTATSHPNGRLALVSFIGYAAA